MAKYLTDKGLEYFWKKIKNRFAEKGDYPTVPTKVSQLENDKGYLTSYTETDPTVPAWAKGETKPDYDYSEIQNTPTLATVATSGKYSDLKNRPNIPTKVSQLENDSRYITSGDMIDGCTYYSQSSLHVEGDNIFVDVPTDKYLINKYGIYELSNEYDSYKLNFQGVSSSLDDNFNNVSMLKIEIYLKNVGEQPKSIQVISDDARPIYIDNCILDGQEIKTIEQNSIIKFEITFDEVPGYPVDIFVSGKIFSQSQN